MELTSFFISPESTIQEAIACIDANTHGIALIVDDQRHLIGTIVDGDIRRAMLANIAMSAPVIGLLARKPESHATPVTGTTHMDRTAMIDLMKERKVRHIPILDDDGRVVDLFSLDDLLSEDPLKLQAVVMAGGFGKRLYPLTQDTPKPMLPVGNRPLMEVTLGQLRSAGINRINITTHYLAEKIKEYFDDGSEFGVEINYVAEDQPLGTAGGVGLVDVSDEPLLVINGDILTQVNYRDMVAYHREYNAVLTMAVRKHEVKIPYGVVQISDGLVHQLEEKPSYAYFVNAGIYLLSPEAHQLIPKGIHMDMTEVIAQLLAQGKVVASFPIREYWLDIGQHTDYDQAQTDAQKGQFDE